MHLKSAVVFAAAAVAVAAHLFHEINSHRDNQTIIVWLERNHCEIQITVSLEMPLNWSERLSTTLRRRELGN